MNKLVEIFCYVDDFYKVFIPQREKHQLSDGSIKRKRSDRLTPSEVMTIVIFFICHITVISTNYYIDHVARFYKQPFLIYLVIRDF